MARPLSKDWMETKPAAKELGISFWLLRKLRRDGALKGGTHYRVKNPQSEKPQYLWHVGRIAKLMTPESVEPAGDRSD